MSYYMGDYTSNQRRMAGVLRGDPGFFSFLKSVGSFAAGFIPGVGPVASKVIEHIPIRSGTVARAVEAGRGGIVKVGSAIIKHPVLSAAGAAGAIAAGGVGAELERHHLLGGRKHKRMNVYNPRALRRALRRAHGFAKMARKIIRVTSHYKHPRKLHIGHFRKKSRKK